MDTTYEGLEKRRRQFKTELLDKSKFPDNETIISHENHPGVPSDMWVRARWFFSIPTAELIPEVGNLALYNLQSIFRADGGAHYRGSLYCYFMMKAEAADQTKSALISDAAFYGMHINAYFDYIVNRSFIGIWAEYESYPQSQWTLLEKKFSGNAETIPYYKRRKYGGNRMKDPMEVMKMITTSAFVKTEQSRKFVEQAMLAKTGLYGALKEVDIVVGDIKLEREEFVQKERADMPTKLARRYSDENLRALSPGNSEDELDIGQSEESLDEEVDLPLSQMVENE